MKKRLLILGTILIILIGGLSASLSESIAPDTTQSIRVLPTTSPILIDGEKVEFEAYNINGNNYFKLRDVAMALNGSGKQFEIIWDGASDAVNIKTGEAYTILGNELSVPNLKSEKRAILSTSDILMNGVAERITAYNVEGYNYFKLRDLGSSIDFGVSWDEKVNTVYIDTLKAYYDQNTEDNFGQQAYSYVEYIQDNLAERLSGTQKERDMARFIQDELIKAGYQANQIELQDFKYTKADGLDYESNNIIVTKKGVSDKVIVVGAHYDSIYSHGVEDNGSGVSVVLETAAKLKDKTLPYTIEFVFFGAEENGIFGSPHYVNSLSNAEVANIGMMINLDCVMVGDQMYIFGGNYNNGRVTDTWAAEQAKDLADKLGLDIELDIKLEPVHQKLLSDQGPFNYKGIPYVFFLAGNLDYYQDDPYRQTVKLEMIMNSEDDDLTLLKTTFGSRLQENLSDYSKLLYYFLMEADISAQTD